MRSAYCDHVWVREDQLTKQCLKCGDYKGVSEAGV